MDTILYRSEILTIGEFTLHPDAAEFNQPACVRGPLLVFPKRPIWIQHEGESRFVADATLINLYNDAQGYRRDCIHPGGDRCHWFHLHDALLREVLHVPDHATRHFDHPNMRCPREVFLLHLQILQHLNTPDPDPWVVEDKTLHMFHRVAEAIQPTPPMRITERHHRLVQQVKHSLLECLDEPWTLQRLAQHHHTSPHHLSRVFKRLCGVGLAQHRTHLRLHTAALKLHAGQRDLSDLALALGFNSHSHMTEHFRRAFGQTPSAFRRRMQCADEQAKI